MPPMLFQGISYLRPWLVASSVYINNLHNFHLPFFPSLPFMCLSHAGMSHSTCPTLFPFLCLCWCNNKSVIFLGVCQSIGAHQSVEKCHTGKGEWGMGLIGVFCKQNCVDFFSPVKASINSAIYSPINYSRFRCWLRWPPLVIANYDDLCLQLIKCQPKQWKQ